MLSAMMREPDTIVINGRRIGPSEPPYVVAEMSANHDGSIDKAMRIVEAARTAGADAVKLQTFTPDTITLDSREKDFIVEGGLWDGRSLHDLYAEAHMPWDWHRPLFEHAAKLGITIFSSPFDRTAVDLLEGLGAPAYKIASLEVVDLPLIRYVAATGKPIIISTGLANVEEIGEAVEAALGGATREVAVLHCVSSYPALASEYNLRTIPDMAKRFGVVTGLSDHTIDSATAIASVALGACIVEKHFTLDRGGGGPDDSFSLEPPELAAMCRDLRTAWESLGGVDYEPTAGEMPNLKFRRSLYFVKDVGRGQRIPADAVRSVRPGFGAPPKLLGAVVGAIAKVDIRANTPVRMQDLDPG
jgi:pseudaminic acid synthase